MFKKKKSNFQEKFLVSNCSNYLLVLLNKIWSVNNEQQPI